MIILLVVAWLVCVGGIRHKLFIYEVPQGCIDRFPSAQTAAMNRLNHEQYKEEYKKKNIVNVFSEDFANSEGFGFYNESTCVFETWQYGLFRNVYSRLLRSPLRTRNPKEATLFFLPYDAGVEGYMDPNGNYQGAGNGFAYPMLDVLQKSEQFQLHYGYDHFMIHSTSFVTQGMGNKLKHLYSYMANSTLISFETLPTTLLPDGMKHVQAIPFTSVFHFHQSRFSIPAIDYLAEGHHHERPYFVSLFAAVHTNMPTSNKLRKDMTEVCQGSNRPHADPVLKGLRQKYAHVCVHQAIEGNRNLPKLHHIIEAYKRSVFCMMPQGDSPVRRGIFDALLAGCIPVVVSAVKDVMSQYDWHFTNIDIQSAFLFIDFKDSDKHPSAGSYVHWLAAISEDEILERQEYIAKIAFQTQYSQPLGAVNRSMPSPVEKVRSWSPPAKDAVDVMLERLFDRALSYRALVNHSTG